MSSVEQKLEITSGFDRSFNVTATDSNGNVIAFDPGDGLSATVWQGGSTSAIATPTTAWINAALGQLKITFSAALTATLAQGIYPIEVAGIRPSQCIEILRGWVQVYPTVGAAALAPVYSTYQDLIDYGGGEWLQSSQKRDSLSNFAAERAKARAWLDDLICRRFRPYATRSGYCGLDYVGGPLDAANPTLAGYLAANNLVVTEITCEVCSLKALDLICRQRLSADANKIWVQRAMYFNNRCSNRAVSYTAELDTDGDGLTDIAIPLGVMSIR